MFSAAGQYLFLSPNHYIFHGAEVYSDSEEETSSSCGSDSEESECSAEGPEDSDVEDTSALATEGETDSIRDTELHVLANDATPRTDNVSAQTQDTTDL